jgi:hypothetical protein
MSLESDDDLRLAQRTIGSPRFTAARAPDSKSSLVQKAQSAASRASTT